MLANVTLQSREKKTRDVDDNNGMRMGDISFAIPIRYNRTGMRGLLFSRSVDWPHGKARWWQHGAVRKNE